LFYDVEESLDAELGLLQYFEEEIMRENIGFSVKWINYF
jgi:hypothetical protein